MSVSNARKDQTVFKDRIGRIEYVGVRSIKLFVKNSNKIQCYLFGFSYTDNAQSSIPGIITVKFKSLTSYFNEVFCYRHDY